MVFALKNIIAVNKIDFTDEKELTQRLYRALEDVTLVLNGTKQGKKARDFLNEL